MHIRHPLRFVLFGVIATCLGACLICPTPAEARQPSQIELARVSREMSELKSAGDALGLGDIPVEDLELGDIVPIASFTKSGEVSRYMSFYPLMYQGDYVAGFLEDSYGELYYQTGLAQLLQRYCVKNDPERVGFIYNAVGLCITDGAKTVLVSRYQKNDESQASLSNLKPTMQQLKSLDLADTHSSVPLKLAALNSKNVPAKVITMNDVSLVTQPNNSNICWAASLSMIYGCHGNTYYRAVDVAKYYLGSNYNRPQSWTWIASTLRNSLNLGNYRYHTGWLSYNTILSYVQKGYPIMGAMKYYRDATHLANTTEHALVIAGCINNNSLIVNNPWPTGGRMIAKPFWNSVYGVYVYYYIDPESTPGNIAYAVLTGYVKID